MTLLEFVKQKHGRVKELADAIQIKSISVSRWALGQRQIPVEHCLTIERVTNHVVTCEELRPDIDWSILRKPKEVPHD